jgi:Flp pilus assembly protein TadD
MATDNSDSAQPLNQLLPHWAAGKMTLKDIKGYTEHELYAIAHMAYFYLNQGKTEEAKVLFEGLVALDPMNGYYYRALGVIFYKLGDSERALRQFGYAIRVFPKRPHAYVNRAEVNIALGKAAKAQKDLQMALSLMTSKEPQLQQKAQALLNAMVS